MPNQIESRTRIPAFYFLCIVCWATAHAQITIEIPYERDIDPIDKEQYWINLGTGIAIRECYTGGPVGVSFSYRNMSSLYSARFVYVAPTNIFIVLPPAHGSINGGCLDRPLTIVRDFSVLYGFIEKERWTFGSISAGPSIIFHRFESQQIGIVSLTSLGLAIDAQGFTTFSPRLGVGVHAFVNINTTASLGGVMLSLQIGKLW